MLLQSACIENFRGIEKLTLEFDQTTVLIGENNSGKTSVLDSLNLCLGRGAARRAVPFDEYDYHLASKDSDPTASPAITITLVFRERAENEWPDSITQGLDKVIQSGAGSLSEVRLKFKSKYDSKRKEFVYEYTFLDLNDKALPPHTRRHLADLQQFVPVFLLTAVRDAGQQFQTRSQFWGSFVRNLQMEDDKRIAIEKQISEINKAVLDSHQPFSEIKTRLSAAAKFVPLNPVDGVSVEPVSARASDMLSRTQVKLAATGGARLPIGQHGAGTQSLAVVFLFEAFLNAKLTEAFDKDSKPLLALEEPESHLHPSAIRALWSTLNDLKGQKIIATHSGDLLSAVPLKAIRRLTKKDGKVKCHAVGDGVLNSEEERTIGYTIRSQRGSLLFARCWLLVEGQSEYWYLPEAARSLKIDFESEGIFCIEYSQVKGKMVSFVKLANALGIEWHLIADGDAAGSDYVAKATPHLAGESASSRITRLPDKDIEHALWNHGYSKEYEGQVTAPRRKCITAKPGDAGYPTQVIDAAISSTSKPELAIILANATNATGSPGVPASVKSALQEAQRLAKRAM